MNKLLNVVAISLAIVVHGAGLASAKSNVGGIRSDLEQENVIRELYGDFTSAWNRHDWQAIANMWALDGDHQEPDGRIAKGRPEIAELMKRQHQTVMRTSSLSLTIDGVWFITADIALVTGDYSVQGIVSPDGSKLAPRGGFLTSILLRERGQWHIAASRLMIPAPLPWRPS